MNYIECFKCHETGHFARECTSSKLSGGGGGVDRSSSRASCYTCGRSGHFGSECRENDKTSRDCDDEGEHKVTCHNCRKSGHVARDCPGGERDDRKCYSCGHSGHIRRDCPEGGNSADVDDTVCYPHSRHRESGEVSGEAFDFLHVTWKIPSKGTSLPNSKVRSSPFSFANETWRLEMQPSYEESQCFTVIAILRLHYQIPERHVFCKFYFETRNGKEFESFSHKHVFEPFTCVAGVKMYMGNSKCLAEKNLLALAPDGVLTVVCQMRTKKIAGESTCSQAESAIFLSSEDTLKSKRVASHDNKVLHDFKIFFTKQDNCDVVLKVKGEEFSAHRAILSARSAVFASTFRNDMLEKKTGVIDIHDCDPSCFSDFLRFLYCGEIQNLSSENVCGLFMAADKYDVEDLAKTCLEFLKENLSVETFCDTITLALRHLQTELIKASTDFFAKHLKEIIVTVKWQSFVSENPIQGNELMIKALVPEFNRQL